MAGLWRLCGHWRQAGYCHIPHPHVVHVYFFPYTGLSYHHLYDPGFLDEYKTVYAGSPEKPVAVSVTGPGLSKFRAIVPFHFSASDEIVGLWKNTSCRIWNLSKAGKQGHYRFGARGIERACFYCFLVSESLFSCPLPSSSPPTLLSGNNLKNLLNFPLVRSFIQSSLIAYG